MSIENEELTFTTSSYFSDQLLDGATQTVERYKEDFKKIAESDEPLLFKEVRYEIERMSREKQIEEMHPSDEFICEKCGLIIRECCRYEIDEDDGDETCYEFPYKFCPRCGMKVKGGE